MKKRWMLVKAMTLAIGVAAIASVIVIAVTSLALACAAMLGVR